MYANDAGLSDLTGSRGSDMYGITYRIVCQHACSGQPFPGTGTSGCAIVVNAYRSTIMKIKDSRRMQGKDFHAPLLFALKSAEQLHADVEMSSEVGNEDLPSAWATLFQFIIRYASNRWFHVNMMIVCSNTDFWKLTANSADLGFLPKTLFQSSLLIGKASSCASPVAEN